MYGYVKVGAAVPRLRLADCSYNKEQIVAMAKEAADVIAAAVQQL